jgi:hypothetical protein
MSYLDKSVTKCKNLKNKIAVVLHTQFLPRIYFSKVTVYNVVTKFQMKTVTAKYTKILELPQAEDTQSRYNTYEVCEGTTGTHTCAASAFCHISRPFT